MTRQIAKIYKIKGLSCPSCAIMLELALEDKNISAKCNFAKAELSVKLEDKSKEEVLKEVVQNEGYEINRDTVK